MNIQELREGHRKLSGGPAKRESLVSAVYPRMFTPSGGPSHVARCLEKQDYDQINTVQPCFRLDYRIVGDGSHLSLFEMGMIASCGIYARDPVIRESLDYLTKGLGLDPKKLIATAFFNDQDDDDFFGSKYPTDNEAIGVFHDYGITDTTVLATTTGMPGEKRLLLQGRPENFEALKSQQFAGPRVEIFYKTDKGLVEFWTSVLYTHRARFEDGTFKFEPIFPTGFAVGYGLERLSQIIHGYESIHLVDTLRYPANDVFGTKITKEREIFVDHVRGLMFLVADGATKLTGDHNRSRKYVVRDYVRRARAVYNDPYVLDDLIDALIARHKESYPELERGKSDIKDEIKGLLDA